MTLTTWNLLAALAASDADVLCLQEVPPARLDAVRAALAPRQLVHAPHLGEGVAIASRQPIFGVETVEVGRKRALVARLADGLRVACVHLTWTGPEGDMRPGVSQLAAVLRLAPDVVAGDFNALPDWPERRFARDAGYVDIGPAAPTCNVNAWLQPLDTVLVRASRWWRGRWPKGHRSRRANRRAPRGRRRRHRRRRHRIRRRRGRRCLDRLQDFFRQILLKALAEVMEAEVTSLCAAPYGSRTDERQNSRNGYRDREVETSLGTVPLEIPRVRQGTYLPGLGASSGPDLGGRGGSDLGSAEAHGASIFRDAGCRGRRRALSPDRAAQAPRAPSISLTHTLRSLGPVHRRAAPFLLRQPLHPSTAPPPPQTTAQTPTHVHAITRLQPHVHA